MVELSQGLLFMSGILEVKTRLLSIVIRLGLLFLYLLFHVGKHLMELIFVLLRWLDTGGCLLKRGGFSVLGGMRGIDDWWGIVPPNIVESLPLDVAPLRVNVCFHGAIGVVG